MGPPGTKSVTQLANTQHTLNSTHRDILHACDSTDVTRRYLLHGNTREVVVHKQLGHLAGAHLAGLQAAADCNLRCHIEWCCMAWVWCVIVREGVVSDERIWARQ
jgi:hypothetical protein